MKVPINADQAARAVYEGRGGTCGILRDDEGRMIFLGFGVRRQVVFLRVEIDGNTFNEETFPFKLFIRKAKGERKAWAVLSDDEYNTLAISGETSAKIRCIALIDPRDPRKAISAYDEPVIPIAMKALFAGEVGGLVVMQNDQDFVALLHEEGRAMIPCVGSEQQSVERLTV